MLAQKSASGLVTVLFAPPHAPPEAPYVGLVEGVSAPTASLVLFTSKVGIARVAVLAAALGLAAGVSATACLYSSTTASLKVWLGDVLILVVYHFLEFFLTALFHPGRASVDSFLVNQSIAYQIAVLAGWFEYWIQVAISGERFKLRPTFMVIGLMLVISGQAIRSLAMFQAGQGFTHLVAEERRPGHRLTTTGVYRYLRHPGYFGWFWWSVGTQIYMCNPVSTIAYAAAARQFFKDRIPGEEEALVRFFPDEYPAYRARTWLGIPI